MLNGEGLLINNVSGGLKTGQLRGIREDVKKDGTVNHSVGITAQEEPLT